MGSHIYLLHEREFINSNIPIYKLGKTSQDGCRRFSGYPKGSIIEIMLKVADHHKCEKDLIAIFDRKFKKRCDIGNEYYEGSSKEMKLEIIKYIPDDDDNIKNNIKDVNNTPVKLGDFYNIYYEIAKTLHNIPFTLRHVYETYNLDKIRSNLGEQVDFTKLNHGNTVDFIKFNKIYKNMALQT